MLANEADKYAGDYVTANVADIIRTLGAVRDQHVAKKASRAAMPVFVCPRCCDAVRELYLRYCTVLPVLGDFRLPLTVSDGIKLYWTVLDCIRVYLIVLDCIRVYWFVLDCI